MEKQNHSLKLKERKFFLATGVIHVDNYDEEEITMKTSLGMLKIQGENLTVKNLNLNEGSLEVEGWIDAIIYFHEQGKKTRNIIEKIFK